MTEKGEGHSPFHLYYCIINLTHEHRSSYTFTMKPSNLRDVLKNRKPVRALFLKGVSVKWYCRHYFIDCVPVIVRKTLMLLLTHLQTEIRLKCIHICHALAIYPH